jgi:hypothetical protein
VALKYPKTLAAVLRSQVSTTWEISDSLMEECRPSRDDHTGNGSKKILKTTWQSSNPVKE